MTLPTLGLTCLFFSVQSSPAAPFACFDPKSGSSSTSSTPGSSWKLADRLARLPEHPRPGVVGSVDSLRFLVASLEARDETANGLRAVAVGGGKAAVEDLERAKSGLEVVGGGALNGG